MDRDLISRLDGCESGAANMQADAAWLDRVTSSPTPLTVLRLYGWEPATVSIGRHQRSRQAFDYAWCREHAVPWVRRPSGGRAVYHDREVTYAIISNDRRRFPGGIMETFEQLAEWLCDGLGQAGVAAARAGRHAPRPPSPRSGRPGACFLTPTRGAVLCGGRKLVGSAQRRRSTAFLQHGSIPLSIDWERMSAALGIDAEALHQSVIPVEEAAGKAVSREDLAAALALSFERRFG